MAYHYVKDKNLIETMKNTCSNLTNELVSAINNEGKIRVRRQLIGSGNHDLITQNGNSKIDLDYNLIIDDFYIINENDGKKIKQYIKEKLDSILLKHEYPNSKDSTSALTCNRLNKENQKPFSMDIGIIKLNHDGTYQRLIHQKTGDVKKDKWFFNIARKYNIERKANYINQYYRDELENVYLNKKNHYLSLQDKNHPSFVCFVEAINEIYNNHNGENKTTCLTIADLIIGRI